MNDAIRVLTETAGPDDTAPRRPPIPRLHLVTDRHRCGNRALIDVVADAARGGLGAVHLRDKTLLGGALLAEAQRLRRVVGAARLLVNERVDVALAAGADGVHLPAGGLPVAVARGLLGSAALIGRSVHSVGEARRAEAEGADYVILGTIFPTASKPGRAPAGLGLVRDTARAVGLPVIAIGGVDEENAAAVVAAGAYGVAVVSAILAAPEPAAAVARFNEVLERASRTGRSRGAELARDGRDLTSGREP